MQVKYKVHSVGPHVVSVKATLPSGQEIDATATLVIAELVPIDANSGGTVSLILQDHKEFGVGDTVNATFEKVD